MNDPFETDHSRRPGTESPDDVLFAVDEKIAYPYEEEASSFDEADSIRPVGTGGAGGGGYDPNAAFADDDVGGESLRTEAAVPTRAPSPQPPSEPTPEPVVHHTEPGHIPGRTRVSYSQGRPKTISSAQFISVKPREPSAAASWIPFLMVLTGTGAGVYFTLLAGSPVLGGVSFIAGATMAMFCRVLLRR